MSLKNLLKKLNKEVGLEFPSDFDESSNEIVLAQKILTQLNEYFFQTNEGIGNTKLNEKTYQYFSEFHKYWESRHSEIINAKINENKVNSASESLNNALINYGNDIFKVTLNTHGLSQQAIANVRFFTAIQDFRIPPENQFEKYIEDSAQFEPKNIYANPSRFLDFLGLARLSQSDKRIDFAKNAARFLMEKNISPFQIARYFNNDAKLIHNAFLENVGMGYGNKKTDMFIRDMLALEIWPDLKNIESINVASDRNTMKLALRTGILQTDIPLLTSFLDIFGYQYEYIDLTSALSWRAVWEKWHKKYPSIAPSSPCLIDFLLYRIGREYCNDIVVQFICEEKHEFYYFGAKKKICNICGKEVIPLKRMLPCQLESTLLPRNEDNTLMLKDSNLLRKFDGVCIFEPTCNPKDESFQKLSPPKSISIIGKTSWIESYSSKNEGGGGMMG